MKLFFEILFGAAAFAVLAIGGFYLRTYLRQRRLWGLDMSRGGED